MYKQLFYFPLYLLLFLILNSYAQIDSNLFHSSPPKDSSLNVTGTELVISNRNSSQSIFLHNLEPINDSCADIEIGFSEINNIKIRFSFDIDKKWNYSGITGDDNYDQSKSIIVNLIQDQDNYLVKVLIAVKSIDDSTKEKSLPIYNSDLKTPPDTSNPLNYSINRITFFCKQPNIIIERKFSYPPDFMRRCPVYNYPELSMFHYGSSVHMPTSVSIWLRGVMIFEYHQSSLPKLTYDSTLTTSDKRAIIEKQQEKIEEEKFKSRQNKPKKVFFKPLW